MKLPSRHAGISIILVLILAIILGVLAVLQIRWTGKVSQADRERMQTNLQTEVGRFRRDFYLQLLRICWAFQSPDEGYTQKALKFYADRYDDWMSASARPDIVRGLFVWDRAEGRLLRLDPAAGRFKPAAGPEELQTLKHDLRQRNPLSSSDEPLVSMGQNWTLDEESHTLFHFFPNTSPKGRENSPRAGPSGGVIIDLNMDFIWRTLLPELVGRYFRGPGGSDYRVSVISGGSPAKIYYQSSPAPAHEGSLTGDIVENLIRDRGSSVAERPAAREELAQEKGEAGRFTNLASRNQRDFLPLITMAGEGNAWRLVVRHRSGSVEAAVLSLRHRNLAVSLSVLLLLAISMALIVISAQRAQRLARLQMDFMAGVSHELRTPLAVICSAAENLADGVVGAPEQVKNYGALIRDEGRQLAEMVGQILSFAAGRGGHRAYQVRPLDVAALVEETLVNIQPSLESERVVVETHLERDIPPVLADPSALERCVKNLISNAVKYGGESRWLKVRAYKAASRIGSEVRISVEDRGSGIESEDMPHIFEPFYRGKNGNGSLIHGTGLGLSIAKDLAEAMGGHLSVASELGKGSCFTLHLPALALHNVLPHQTL